MITLRLVLIISILTINLFASNDLENINNEFITRLNKNNNVSMTAFGTSQNKGKIEGLIMFLQFYQTENTVFSKKELIKKLVNMRSLYLDLCRSRIKNTSDFYHLPLSKENIDITIVQVDKFGHYLFHPVIAEATLAGGYFSFQTINPDNEFEYIIDIREKELD